MKGQQGILQRWKCSVFNMVELHNYMCCMLNRFSHV